MKLSVKTKLIAGGIAVMLATGGTGIIVNHYSSGKVNSPISQESSPNLLVKSISNNDKVAIKNGIPLNKKANQTKLPSNEQNINIAVIAHEAGDSKIEGNKISSSNQSGKPLSLKEKLLERIHQMDKNPEFKALNDRVNQLTTESYELTIPLLPINKKIEEHMKNPWSALGLTHEEAMQRELTKGEIAYMRKVGQDLDKEADKYRNAIYANQEERERIYKQMLALLGMTDAEYRYALEGNESSR